MTVSDIADAKSLGWRMPAGTLLRYGASAAGPAAVSGAHFLASLILLHLLPAREFGLFSFVMVVVAFGVSLNAALISVPLTRSMAAGDSVPFYFQMNWLVCLTFAALLFAGLWLSALPLQDALVLALYAAAFIFRWFARGL